MKKNRIATASAISTFMTCPKKYDFSYNECIAPSGTVAAFATGGVVHRGLESYWERKGTKEIFADMAAYRLENDRQFWQSADGDIEAARTNAYVSGYINKWKGEDFQKYEVIDVEKEFLFGTEDFPMQFAGKMDVVLRRKSDGQLIIMDHKTASSGSGAAEPGSPYWQKLVMDNQIATYLFAARQVYGEPAAFAYDVLIKTSAGPKGSKARQKKDESRHEFLQRKSSGMEPVEAFAARLKEEHSFATEKYIRKEVVVTDDELKQKLVEFRSVMPRMLEPEYLRNSTNCVRGSIVCPYLGLCTGEDSRDSMAFKRKMKAHTELTYPDKLERALRDFT